MEVVREIEENDVIENSDPINREYMFKHPLNQILYGPAGTPQLPAIPAAIAGRSLDDPLLLFATILIAVGFHAVAWKLVLVLVLQWLTSPLSSHMLSMFEYRADENLGQHLDLSDAEYHTEDEEVAAK